MADYNSRINDLLGRIAEIQSNNQVGMTNKELANIVLTRLEDRLQHRAVPCAPQIVLALPMKLLILSLRHTSLKLAHHVGGHRALKGGSELRLPLQ